MDRITENNNTQSTATSLQEENSKKMEEKSAENEEKDSKDEGLLIAINGAKIKFNAHLGEFKVLNDVPTTQDKLTGTIVEKQIPNFTFYEGFHMIALTDWQDFETAKVQDNDFLLKKSFLPGTGKLPGNIPPETGKIEFVDSGQINVPESIDTMLAPVPEDNSEYVYYTKECEYIGGVENSLRVYLTAKNEYESAKKDKKWLQINKTALHLTTYASHSDFRYISYFVKMEAGEEDLKELKCIAFTSHNRSVKGGKSLRSILASSYSSVPVKKEMPLTNENKNNLSKKAGISVIQKEKDITKGAEYWDGTDFLAWGNSEQNPYNKLGQNKFDEYKFIEIPNDVYDSFLDANESSARYGDKGKHDEKNDHGTHEHIKKKVKKIIKGKDGKPVLGKDGKPTFEEVQVPSKIKYSIPAAEFKDKNNWTTGNFYYDTGVKTTNGISGTISAGKSIFWKITPTKLLK